jgi:hypothetical protein
MVLPPAEVFKRDGPCPWLVVPDPPPAPRDTATLVNTLVEGLRSGVTAAEMISAAPDELEVENVQEPFEEIPKVNDFVRFKLGWFLLIIGVVAGAVLMLTFAESQFGHSTVGTIGTLRDAGQPNTKPEDAAEAASASAAFEARVTPAAVVHEIDTLTTGDAQALIGRKVDLTVPVLGRNVDQAFWVGAGDHQMLVAVRRDHRSDDDRYYGVPSDVRVASLKTGGSARIIGTIEPAPSREEMFNWALTTHDVEQLEARPIYISADSVQPAQ